MPQEPIVLDIRELMVSKNLRIHKLVEKIHVILIITEINKNLQLVSGHQCQRWLRGQRGEN